MISVQTPVARLGQGPVLRVAARRARPGHEHGAEAGRPQVVAWAVYWERYDLDGNGVFFSAACLPTRIFANVCRIFSKIQK